MRARHTAYRPRQGNHFRPVAQDIVLLRRLLFARTWHRTQSTKFIWLLWAVFESVDIELEIVS